MSLSLAFPSLEIYMPLWIGIAVFGFTGSLHCAGMCGPLAAASCGAQPVRSPGWLYHVARICAYMVLGFLSGALGEIFFQNTVKIPSENLAIVLGAVMACYALVECSRACRAFLRNETFQSGAMLLKRSLAHQKFPRMDMLRSLVRRGMQRLNLPLPVSLGLLTAFLPCGFLYAAVAQAVFVSDPIASGIGMMVFALATTPALILGTVAASVWQRTLPRFGGVLASFILLMASLSILYRGMVQPHCHDHDMSTSSDPS